MRTFRLRIYTTEHPFFDGECESLIAPTSQGLYGIMAWHRDMVAPIAGGELQYRVPLAKTFERVAVSAGMLFVFKNEVTILVETAEKAGDIDFARAMKQYERAKENLKGARNSLEKHMAETNLSRALTRLKVRSGPKK